MTQLATRSDSDDIATATVPIPVQVPTTPLLFRSISERTTAIREAISGHMAPGIDYGPPFPGSKKNTLLKAGLETLCKLFELGPRYAVQRVPLTEGVNPEHREYEVTTDLFHLPTDRFVGQGVGSCSTMESKYRWRQGERRCPQCGQAAIIKGRQEYGGGFVCFAKKGGCGAKFPDGDQQIVGQSTARTENPDLPDLYNTVLKMAKKRSLADAILTATGGSHFFDPDAEVASLNGYQQPNGGPNVTPASSPDAEFRGNGGGPTFRQPQPPQPETTNGNGNGGGPTFAQALEAGISRGLTRDQARAIIVSWGKDHGAKSWNDMPDDLRQGVIDGFEAGAWDLPAASATVTADSKLEF